MFTEGLQQAWPCSRCSIWIPSFHLSSLVNPYYDPTAQRRLGQLNHPPEVTGPSWGRSLVCDQVHSWSFFPPPLPHSSPHPYPGAPRRLPLCTSCGGQPACGGPGRVPCLPGSELNSSSWRERTLSKVLAFVGMETSCFNTRNQPLHIQSTLVKGRDSQPCGFHGLNNKTGFWHRLWSSPFTS